MSVDPTTEQQSAESTCASLGRTQQPGPELHRRRPRGVRIQWRRLAASNIAIGFILSVFSWHSSAGSLVVTPGLDPSWRTTLETAAHNGTPFGTHVVFTYGPLGFLDVVQLNYAWPAVLAFAFTITFSVMIFATLLWALRHTVPLWLAVPVAFVVGGVSLSINPGPEDVLPLVLIVCVAILTRTGDGPAPLWMWVGLGVILSIFSLMKVSLSVGITAALIVTVICLPSHRLRATGALVVGALPAFCVGWFGTGNGAGNLLDFIRSSASIIIGYGPAMELEVPARRYVYGWAIAIVALVVVYMWFRSRGLALRARMGIALVTTLILWLLFKEGFVRHDSHDLIFLAAAPMVLVAFAPWCRNWAVMLGALSLTAVTVGVAGAVPPSVTDPVVSAQNFAHETVILASGGRRAAVIEQSRRSLRASYALSNRMQALTRDQTVDVSPWEQTVTWAYSEMRLDSLPVIQDYSAYTPSLDQLDSNYLESPDAPRFILRQPGLAVDGRNPAFEPPVAQLTMECRYRQIEADASWQLVERGADRCGPSRFLGSVTTTLDHWIQVPSAPASDAVVASFQLSQGWKAKVEAIVFKPPEVFLHYNTIHQEWRFVAATGIGPHVIRPASTLGYDPGFTPEPMTRLSTSIPGEGTDAGVTVLFYEVHFGTVSAG